MATEQIFVCSKIFLAFGIVLSTIAILIFIVFDIKRMIKILRGKKITPVHNKMSTSKSKLNLKKLNPQKLNPKTELLTMPLGNTQPMITMDISYIHSDIEL
jgi:hypothetical protein